MERCSVQGKFNINSLEYINTITILQSVCCTINIPRRVTQFQARHEAVSTAQKVSGLRKIASYLTAFPWNLADLLQLMTRDKHTEDSQILRCCGKCGVVLCVLLHELLESLRERYWETREEKSYHAKKE